MNATLKNLLALVSGGEVKNVIITFADGQQAEITSKAIVKAIVNNARENAVSEIESLLEARERRNEASKRCIAKKKAEAEANEEIEEIEEVELSESRTIAED